MQPKSKREQCAAAIAAMPPVAQLTMFSCLHAAWRAHRDGTAPTLTDEQRRALKRQRRRKGPRQRFKRAATPVALLLVLALASGCAGVTAEDLAPHVATAQNLADRNNAAIATHCVGMPLEDRQALIRDNIDHAAQLGALQQSAGDGPGWLSQVIAWALSFSRLAGIVAADPEIDAPDEHAMDGNNGDTTEPDAPAPDDDGDGTASAREFPAPPPYVFVRVQRGDYLVTPAGSVGRLVEPPSPHGRTCSCGCLFLPHKDDGWVWVEFEVAGLTPAGQLEYHRKGLGPDLPLLVEIREADLAP